MYSMNQIYVPRLSSPAFILVKIEKRPLRIDPIENFLPWTAHIIVLDSQRRETERGLIYYKYKSISIIIPSSLSYIIFVGWWNFNHIVW